MKSLFAPSALLSILVLTACSTPTKTTPVALKPTELTPLSEKTRTQVQRAFDLESAEPGLISPGEKKSYFFNWTRSGVSQVWRLDSPSAQPVQVTSGVEATRLVDFSPDGQFLIVAKARAGEKNEGLYLVSADGSSTTEIFHKPGVRVEYGWITNDAQSIYYTANDTKPDATHLYQFSVPQRTRVSLTMQEGEWFVADTWGDATILMGKRKGENIREYWVFIREENKWAPIVGQNESGDYEVTFAKGAGEVLVATNNYGEYRKLYHGQQGQLKAISFEEPNDIDSIKIDRMRFRIYLNRNVKGRQQVEVMDPKTFDLLKLPSIEGADDVSVGNISRLGRFVTLSASQASNPKSTYVYDWASKQLTLWTRAGKLQEKVAKAVLESFPARDGSKIPMWVRRPEKCSADPCSVVVRFHDGPTQQSRPVFDPTAQALVNSGFIVVDPNIRGSSGYGKKYAAADDGEKGLVAIGDAADLAKHIKTSWRKKDLTPKIAAIGEGYGGFVTLAVQSYFSGSYDAALSIGGPIRISEKFEASTANIKAPTLLVYGARETLSHQLVSFQDRLAQGGVQAPLILMDDEGHQARTREGRIFVTGKLIEFLEGSNFTAPLRK